MKASLQVRVGAEFLGTAFLLMVIVGSGIMAERLSAGNMAIALLANSLATGCGLYVLISALTPVSGAHFNPVVTLSEAWLKRMGRSDAAFYAAAQFLGAYTGVAAANLMFELPAFFLSQHVRLGKGQLFGEFVATFGLVAVIQLAGCFQPRSVPFVVAAYIAAAYWFTSSTSFANPAVTLGRTASDTFSGIRLADAPGFVVAQLLGGAAATGLLSRMLPAPGADSAEVRAGVQQNRPQAGRVE
jgi:glycerol uptake facilitator-like aquaporin